MKKKLFLIFIIGLCITVIVGTIQVFRYERVLLLSEPVTVTIPQGSSVISIARQLEEMGIIRSHEYFLVRYSMLGKQTIRSGVYVFENDTIKTVQQIIVQLQSGDYGASQIRVTLPEGITRNDMANTLNAVLPNFDTQEFLEKTKNYEGYLFPSTYFFFVTTTTEEVIEALQREHDLVKKSFEAELEKSSRSWNDIIIMASILEREAKNSQEAHVISGILWKRISINMPLQVDATFLYEIGKGSAELTRTDLQTDSPYNTYTRRGLPAGPIGNPGRAMIRAALEPVDSPYLFYLHGSDGRIHYGKNFNEHVANRKYLR